MLGMPFLVLLSRDNEAQKIDGKLTNMLIFLHRTYRGRTHKWWLQSAMIFILAVGLCLFTYYFLDLYRQFQRLRAESNRLEPYISVIREVSLDRRQDAILSRVNAIHEYLQYLNQFEQFEKKARFAKWMRVYHSKNVLYHQKNELELALTSDLAAPVMIMLGKELSAYSQKWEGSSLLEKKQLQFKFKQTTQVYEMVAKRHGYKILSSDSMRNMIIQSWYAFMLNQAVALPSYQELYPKLDSLVEFYFQMPTVENNWVEPDRALLEKSKNQLKLA